jgi:Tol biopolymer transport system component
VRTDSLIYTALLFFPILIACVTDQVVEETVEAEVQVPAPVEEQTRIIELDYDRIELGLLEIVQVEEKPGLFNSYNPQFASDERYLAFEVNQGNFKKIHIYSLDTEKPDGDFNIRSTKVREVYLDEAFDGEFTEDMFESSSGESFNYEFTWFPGSSSFIFTSNAGLGEYNLFIGSVEKDDETLKGIRARLDPKEFRDFFMMTEEIQKDGQAKISPDGQRIVFTSGRTGNGDLYLFDLENGKLIRLTANDDTDFFPRWSPDGSDIVYTTGGKQSHDIRVIRNAGKPGQTDELMVKWFFDDVLASFSPDGKYISFYTTYNTERDPFNTKRWGIMIIPSDGSAPKAGQELVEYFHVSDVIKDNTQGAAWFPDSGHIIYAKNIDSDYNPIYIYNIGDRVERLIETGTDINHDITVSSHGLVSFRAQLFGWDRIFIASTTYFQEYLEELYTE